MPYANHVDANTPEGDRVIWRYMDFPKLFALLHTSKLYLPSLETMSKTDPYEGSVTDAQHQTIREKSQALYRRDAAAKKRSGTGLGPTWASIHPELKQEVEALTNEERKRRSEYVSCWHMNEDESDAMWKLYGLRGQGIAIRSTISLLREAIQIEPTDVYLGQVRYVDYKRDVIPLDKPMRRILSKRRSFAHEHEVRLVSLNYPSPLQTATMAYALFGSPPGVSLSADLSKLIDSIWVSPDSEPWVAATVQAVVGKFGIDPRRVHHSPLNRRDPVFLMPEIFK